MMLPLGERPRPLQPTSRRKISHCPPGVYLMMSPRVAWPCGKFEKKNAPWLGIQVGPSLYVYRNWKPAHAGCACPAIGFGKGPGGQTNRPPVDPSLAASGEAPPAPPSLPPAPPDDPAAPPLPLAPPVESFPPIPADPVVAAPP